MSTPKINATPNTKINAKSKPKSTTAEPLPINVDELEKIEMVKSRLLAENIWYKWNDWLISHIPLRFGKKSATDAKQKTLNLSEAKIYNNRQKKIARTFGDVGVGEGVGVEGLSMQFLSKHYAILTQYDKKILKNLVNRKFN